MTLTDRQTVPSPEYIEQARSTAEACGWRVLKEASYRRAQERQRIAEALLRNGQEHVASTERWARECCERERRMSVRTSYLYGLAKAHGASDDELAGGMEP